MGVDPRAPAIKLKEMANINSKCKFCGEVYSIAEMINSYTCIDCYGENKNIDKKCKSCLEVKALNHFLTYNVSHDICDYCREKKKCINCGKIFYRFLFIKNGVEREYCSTCLNKKNY